MTSIIFLDMRWLRGGDVRGIGQVSLNYMTEIGRMTSFDCILITTKKSKEYLIDFLKERKIEDKFEIEVTGIIYGDIAGISKIIKKRSQYNYMPSIYIGFGNTIAAPVFSVFNQYIFIHDFAWKNIYARSFLDKFIMSHIYVQLNHMLLSSVPSKFFTVSEYIIKQVSERSVYKSRMELIYNPVAETVVADTLDKNLEQYENSICWVGGDSYIKNKSTVIKVIRQLSQHAEIINFHVVGLKNINPLSSELLNVKLHYHGHLSNNNMQKIILNCEILYVPSLSESFSLPAVTAYNNKKIIVGTINSPFSIWFKSNYIPINPVNYQESADKLIEALNMKPNNVDKLNYSLKNQSKKLLDKVEVGPPIVVYHFGRQNYFKSMVALLNRVGFRPIVISGNSLFHRGVARQMVISEGNENNSRWGYFMKFYEHMSTNGYRNELLCFKRWFDIYDLMKRDGCESFWHFDSDIVVSADFHAYKSQIEKHDSTVIFTPEQRDKYQMASSAHVSFWRIKDLELFLDFLIFFYKKHKPILLDKWNHHVDHNLSGGVCDMTLLYLWSHSKVSPQSGQILNSRELHKDKWNFNDNINTLNKNKGFGLLKIYYKGGCFFEKGNQNPLPFIHCQGRSKILINLLRMRFPIFIALKATLGFTKIKHYLAKCI